MLQENARLSSDRFLCIREKQPYFSTARTNYSELIFSFERIPIVADHVSTGEVCAFVFQVNDGYSWDIAIGKILQFSNDKSGPYNRISFDELADIASGSSVMMILKHSIIYLQMRLSMSICH